MKRIMTIAALMFVMTDLATSRPLQKTPDDSTDLTRHVLDAEKDRIHRLVRGDFEGLERILSDDLVYTHSTGVSETKAEYLESLRSGAVKYRSMDHENVSVRIYGDTAILNGRSKVEAVAGRQQVNTDLRFTLVYVRRQDRWRMVSWQSTRITQ